MQKLNVTYSELKGSGVSDDDIDGQSQGDTKSPAIQFCDGSERLINCAGVECTPDWTSGDGGYDAGLKEARLIWIKSKASLLRQPHYKTHIEAISIWGWFPFILYLYW